MGDMTDFRLFRLRNLLSRRPFMESDVLLRGNPHDCNHWLRRI